MEALSSNVSMPSKKPSIFEVSGKEPKAPKAPTLSQFLKQQNNAVYPIYSLVSVIWYPGNWDNYSLECELFRVSVSPSHPLFEPLDKGITKFCMESKCGILLRVDDGEGTIGLAECTRYGDWNRISNAGFRFKPANDSN